LSSASSKAGQSTAQLVTAIAAIELPRNEWPELMGVLVQNVASGSDHLKQASLTTIGFICETPDADVRLALTAHSNAVLTAVVQGARRDEPNSDVRHSALQALGDAVDFIRSNMDNEGERNYIMQVVCEATQAEDTRIQASAFGCLNRIMGTYYDKMRFYMEKALFGLTIMGMKNDDEDVAKLAIEFWCTVCEEEIAIEDDNAAVSFSFPFPNRFWYLLEDDIILTLPHRTRIISLLLINTLLFRLRRQKTRLRCESFSTSPGSHVEKLSPFCFRL
jgi:importin subunit beta-1